MLFDAFCDSVGFVADDDFGGVCGDFVRFTQDECHDDESVSDGG